MKLSIIVPTYNEEKTIGQTLKKLTAVAMPEIEKEIIVVDDGSTDGTPQVLNKLKSSTLNLKIIRHPQNQGKGAAVRTGLNHASGDYLIIQDADLEYDPQFIPKLLAPILKNQAQVVYGTRLKRWPHLNQEERTPRFLLHYLGNRFLSFLTSLLYGQFLTDMETGYKLFPRAVALKLNLQAESFNFEPEITAKLLKSGLKITEVPITTQPRGYAEGKKLDTLRDGLIAFITLFKYRFSD